MISFKATFKICLKIIKLDYWAQALEPKWQGHPLAFTCKMSLKETRTNQEETQNDHKEA